MELDGMTFEEFLFNGRYHIIGAIMFLVFLVVFVREAVREILAERAQRRGEARRTIHGPVVHDLRLGPTMADGGEPADAADEGAARDQGV